MFNTDAMTNILNIYDYDYLECSDVADEFYDENYAKSKKRAIRRKNNIAKAKRKQKIASNIYFGDHPYYSNLHQYSKNKIHCSCWRCAFNFPTNKKSYTHSDLMRIEKIKYDEKEYLNKESA